MISRPNQTLHIMLVGGTGFVGQTLGVELARLGHRLTVLTRNPDRWVHKMAFPCEMVSWDSARDDLPLRAQNLPDVIVNLAGAGIADQRWSTTYKTILRNSRINTTVMVAKAIKVCHETYKHQVHLVQASAVGFYGSQGDKILAESDHQGQGFLAQLCNDWEHEALRAATQHNRVCILRIGPVLGFGGGFFDTLLPLYMGGIGAIVGSGQQWMPWIHIDDLINILAAAVTSDQWNGVYNATAPHPVTMKELHQNLLTYFGRQYSPRLPAWGANIGLGEKSEIVLGSQRALPARLAAEQNHKFSFKYQNLNDALQQLFPTKNDRNSGHLVSRLWVPNSRREVWSFFSDETNLETITPEFLSFQVKSKSKEVLEGGTDITYRLKVHGIPMTWITHIADWEPPHLFVDIQTKGPYKFWHHTHTFEELSGGTLMTDHVRYRLPLGKLGWLVASALVRRDIMQIFAYREQKVAEIFSGAPRLQIIGGGKL